MAACLAEQTELASVGRSWQPACRVSFASLVVLSTAASAQFS